MTDDEDAEGDGRADAQHEQRPEIPPPPAGNGESLGPGRIVVPEQRPEFLLKAGISDARAGKILLPFLPGQVGADPEMLAEPVIPAWRSDLA